MATVKKVPPIVPEVVDTVKVRTQGLQLIAPLQAEVRALQVKSASDYLDADEMLGRVRNARSRWKSLMAPIVDPLQRMKADLKLQEQGIKNLNSEVDGPMEQLEGRVKDAMRTFKVEEARQLQAAREEEAWQERERQAAIEAARRKEEAARTPQMKAKLAEARAKLEVPIESVSDLNPIVRGASSSSRTLTKVRVVDVGAFVSAMQDYEPKASIYKTEHPPCSLIDPEMLRVRLNALFKDQPGIVETWPGLEVYQDVIIAGR